MELWKPCFFFLLHLDHFSISQVFACMVRRKSGRSLTGFFFSVRKVWGILSETSSTSKKLKNGEIYMRYEKKPVGHEMTNTLMYKQFRFRISVELCYKCQIANIPCFLLKQAVSTALVTQQNSSQPRFLTVLAKPGRDKSSVHLDF